MSQVLAPKPRIITFKTTDCYDCGIHFGMPTEFYDNCLRSRQNFYCPNGHGMHFIGETEEQRRIKKLEVVVAEKERTERWLREDLTSKREQLQKTNRSLVATRGVVTRQKRRIQAGQCVCCSKKFKDLEHHMATRHPDWSPEKHADALEAKS